MSTKSLLILFIVQIGLFVTPSQSISCLDESGRHVDWFTIYKLPQKQKSGIKWLDSGLAHTYTTSSNNAQWSLSKRALNESSSMLGRTLSFLYKTKFADKLHRGYVLWNDQFEGESDSGTYAHSKGVLLFDYANAVWIEHSIPNFPPKRESKAYNIGSSQLDFGQSVICLSLSLSSLSKIGQQLFYAFPQVYDYFIPASMSKNPALQNLINVVNKKHVTESPFKNVETITTLGNAEFVTFYKFSQFYNDLYSSLVAPDLKTALLTQTWRRGNAAKTPSDCSTSYSVNNILTINFKPFGVSFSGMSDHSKWAVSTSEQSDEAKYVCIGDINRQDSQKKRGGGTICFKNNPNVWRLYHDIVGDVEPCTIFGGV